MCAGAHDEGSVALKGLQIVHVSVVGAELGILSDDVEFFPLCLKVILSYFGAVATFAEREGGGYALATVGRCNAENVTHFIERDLLLYTKAELAANFTFEE